MKPIIKKIKGRWAVSTLTMVVEHSWLLAAMAWCHNRNINEGNYRVKTQKA